MRYMTITLLLILLSYETFFDKLMTQFIHLLQHDMLDNAGTAIAKNKG